MHQYFVAGLFILVNSLGFWLYKKMDQQPHHLPNHGRHHLTGKEGTEHGESLREQQPHDREHQHQASMQIWHTKQQHKVSDSSDASFTLK